MKPARVITMLAALALVLTACGAAAGSTVSGGSATGSYDTSFPLPPGVSNFTKTGDDAINFQTTLSLMESLEFYRNAFSQAGLTERTINTSTTDTTFSVVFDGDSSGKAIVVQGVDLGNGTTNINVRHEDV